MFTAWVIDSDGEVRKQFDDCMQVSVLTEEQMQMKYPEIIDAIGYTSNYVSCLVVFAQDPIFTPCMSTV